jgi:hypothetical protein
MILRFVLWNLADSKTTIHELRRYLRDESADAFADVPGLRFKAWISERQRAAVAARARVRVTL